MNDSVLWLSARLASLGDSLVAWIGSANLWAAALFALAFALDRLLSARVAAGWRALLYVPVAVRLLLPQGVGIALPLVAVTRAHEVAAGPARTEAIGALSSADPSALPGGFALAPAALVPVAYLAVATLLVVRWWRESQRLRAILRESSDAPAWLRGLARTFDIVEHPSAGPMLVGVRLPRLVMPSGLVDRVGIEGVRAIVRHEAAHVARRDPLLAAVLHAAVIAAWPIVAVWCAASRVRALMEMACDERSLRDADVEARRAYGRALIDLASTSPPRRFGVALGFGSALHERIASIRRSGRRWALGFQASAAIGASALLAACGAAQLTTRPESPTEPSARAEPGTAAPEQHEIHLRILGGSIDTVGPDGTAVIRADQLELLARTATVSELAAPRLVTLTGERATITIGNDASTITLHAAVIRSIAPQRTVELEFVETGSDGAIAAQRTATVELGTNQAAALGVTGAVQRTILLELQPAPRAVPILRDLPILNTLFTSDATSRGADAPTYPQVLCMVNLVRADGPLTLSAAGMIEQGRDEGTHHRVLSPASAAAIFERMRELRGYENLAAPAILLMPGAPGAIEVGSTDKPGNVVGVRVELSFAERDGALEGSMRLFDGPVGEGVDLGFDAQRLVEGEAVVAVLPAADGDPSHGLIVLLRPTVIRSAAEHPVQRGN